MIDLAKQLKNNAQMITLAQIFAQQPRNSVSITLICPLAIPFLKIVISQARKASSTVNKHPRTRSWRGYFNANLPGLSPRPLSAELQLGALARFLSGVPPL